MDVSVEVCPGAAALLHRGKNIHGLLLILGSAGNLQNVGEKCHKNLKTSVGFCHSRTAECVLIVKTPNILVFVILFILTLSACHYNFL